MSFDYVWKRFVAFGAMAAIGLFGAAFLQNGNLANNHSAAKIVYSTSRENSFPASDGTFHGRDEPEKTSKSLPSEIKGLKIISKPRAVYTEQAKTDQIQGKVLLKVTFTANGQIGAISTISGLPDGLTEASIAAARNIKFEPATQNGKPITVTKPIEYSFTIY
jgi:TonB family protein